MQRKLIKLFGNEIKADSGAVHRRRLADIVYADCACMKLADAVIDPVLCELVEETLLATTGIVLLEWALIAEKNRLGLTNHNALLVSCGNAVQRQRLLGEDLPVQQGLKRINGQLSNASKARHIRAAQLRHGGHFYQLTTDVEPSPAILKALLDHIQFDATGIQARSA